MKTRPTNHSGKILALGILLLGFSLALISRNYYNARHPSALEARFVAEYQVLARFAPKDIPAIRPGLPARISVGETGYFATVAAQNGEEFILMLTGPNSASPTNGSCRVTVDASIPPEALKPPQ